MKKLFSVAIFLILILVLCAGCGKEPFEITIRDQKNSVSVAFEKGKTVADYINRIGLVLNEKDEITPSVDTVPEEPVEISIARYAKVNVVINTMAEGKTESRTVSIELVGGTVADALEKAGVVTDKNVTVNCGMNVYLSDLDEDIVVVIGASDADESTSADATEESQPTTEEVTTEAETTTERTYREEENDITSTTYNRGEWTTNPPVTEPPTAPPVDEPVVTDPPATDAPDIGGEIGGGTEKQLDRTEWVPDCDGSGGYVIYWYTDGSADTEIFEEKPDWI